MNVAERVRAVFRIAARLAALGATLCVLLATSPAAVCDTHWPPVVFRAQGTCGPEGLVLASVDDFSGRISFGNATVLGLPPEAQGEYVGEACQANVDRGGWRVRIAYCSADGGTSTACQRTCTVQAVASGPLQFVCVDPRGASLCSSTLTVVE